VGLQVLVALEDSTKIDETNYSSKCPIAMQSLWGISDRAIRTSLLKSCKTLLPITPSIMVNKHIFEPMIAGFGDSNPKMREETLKNLIYIVDKLDERSFQDRLVKCITSLQNDTENSIRTNATIFLGRLAPKLKEITRNRLLCQQFVKAMKDNFVHCRVAGLRAAVACISLVDANQLASVLLPQACLLTIDKSADVRQLAISLVDGGLKALKSYNETALLASAEIAASSSMIGDKSPKTESATVSSTWATWAVDELSKTFERVSSSEPAQKHEPKSPSTSVVDKLDVVVPEVLPQPSTKSMKIESLVSRNDSAGTNDSDGGWDNDISWSDDDNNDEIRQNSETVQVLLTPPVITKSTAAKDMELRTVDVSLHKLGSSKVAVSLKKKHVSAMKLSMDGSEGGDANWDEF